MTSEVPYARVTPAEVCRRLERADPMVLVDVRTPAEYARRHIPGILFIPMNEFAARLNELPPDREIVCLCEHGIRSEMAAQYLAALGYPRAATMTGGMAEYTGPVESDG